MIVFLDTNILLDVLADREPFAPASRRLWELSELNRVVGTVSAISFNNIYYILRKAANDRTAREALKKMRAIFTTAEVDSKILQQAIDSDIRDFEDAVQYFSSLRSGADYVITRNPDDFPDPSPVPVVTPEIFLAGWDSRKV
jgi:predicted nucleic acid-binding protein